MNNFSDSTPIATTEQYRAALLAVRQRMTDVQLKMLQAHCRSVDHMTSLDHLADLLNLPSWSGARIAYRNYASFIAKELNFTPGLMANKPVWLCAIAYGQPDANGKLDGQYEWILRPELVQALTAMKWV